MRCAWACVTVALVTAGCSSAAGIDGDTEPKVAPETTTIPVFDVLWDYTVPTDEDDRAQLGLDALRGRLVVAGGCAPSSGEPARQQFIEALPDVARPSAERAFDHLQQAERHCDEDAEAWRSALFEAVAELAVVEAALTDPTDPADARDRRPVDDTLANDTATLASATVTQYDRIHAVLNPAGPAQRSPHWFGPSESIVITELRQLGVDGQSPTILLTGDSVMKHGIEVPTLRDAGLDAYNAAIPSGSPVVQQHLTIDALALAPNVETIVWDVTTHWLFGRACRESEIYVDVVTSREAIFNGVPAARGADPFDLLLGPDPAAPIYWLDGYGLPETNTYGNGPLLVGVNQNGRGLAEAERRYETDPSICRRALSVIDNALTTWSTAAPDARIIVVLAPMSDQTAAFHPEGRAGHEPLATQLRDVVEAAGAEYVDMSDLVDQSGFHDSVHYNEVGRAIFTEAILDELR